MGRRGVLRASVAVVVVALAAAGIAKSWSHPPRLTTISRPVSNANQKGSWDSYWLTANQLLILTTEQEPTAFFSPHGALTLTHWKGSADILNINTGIRTHLVGLTKLLHKKTVCPLMEPSEFQLSPDGAWVLWRLYRDRHHFIPYPTKSDHTSVQRKSFPQRPPLSDYRTGVNGVIGMAHLDGTHYRTWNIGRPAEEFFPDAQHQVQAMAGEPALVVHDLQNPAKDREYPKQEQAKKVLLQYAARHPIFIVVRNDPHGLKQFWVETYRIQDSLGLLRYSPMYFGEPAPMYKRRIQMPEGSAMSWPVVSPHQQYISYSLKVSREAPIRKWLHRLVPKFAIKPITIEELWISRADGQDMHQIGYVPSEEDDMYRITGEKWLPDDKHISFYYNDKLNIVPIEPTK